MTDSAAAPLPISVAELRARVGEVIATSAWFEVTQSLINDFAQASHDVQWIHVDPQRAAVESPFKDDAGKGVTVAHGFLTLSLLSHFHQATFTIPARASLNVGFEKLRFTAPVPAGSRIRSVFKLADVYDVSRGTQFQWAVTIEREGSKRPVLLADWLTRVVE